MSAVQELNWHIIAAALSGVFSVWSIFPYVGDILRGGPTKPNIVSFFLWTVCETIAFIAQIKAGWSWSIVIMGLVVFNTSIILVLAVFGYGYKKYHHVDAVSFLCSVLAILLWQKTDDPNLAIVFSICADLFACIPTLVKIHREPHSEHMKGWLLITVATVLGALSTEIYDFPNLAFPSYLVLINFLILGFIYFGRSRGGVTSA